MRPTAANIRPPKLATTIPAIQTQAGIAATRTPTPERGAACASGRGAATSTATHRVSASSGYPLNEGATRLGPVAHALCRHEQPAVRALEAAIALGRPGQ